MRIIIALLLITMTVCPIQAKKNKSYKRIKSSKIKRFVNSGQVGAISVSISEPYFWRNFMPTTVKSKNKSSLYSSIKLEVTNNAEDDSKIDVESFIYRRGKLIPLDFNEANDDGFDSNIAAGESQSSYLVDRNGPAFKAGKRLALVFKVSNGEESIWIKSGFRPVLKTF